jgi:ADP-ribosylglycohydrolase
VRTRNSPRIDLLDRARGCILAGAIGDALGGPFEGQPGPLQFQQHDNWSISDDTQLTLATCESIAAAKGVSPEQIAARFVIWFRVRRITGMGASTLKALRDLDAGIHWALAGAKGEMSAGNGAAMRIAPLAFCLDPSVADDRRVIRDVVRITHHHEEAYVGALAVAQAIRYLAFQLSGSPENLLDVVLQSLPDSRVRDRIRELASLEAATIAEVAGRFGSSGYVVDSVPLALYAAQSSMKMPLDVILREVIEAGGDTDTIASITGQIVGAWIGSSNIPVSMIESLPDAESIKHTAEEFSITVERLSRRQST